MTIDARLTYEQRDLSCDVNYGKTRGNYGRRKHRPLTPYIYFLIEIGIGLLILRAFNLTLNTTEWIMVGIAFFIGYALHRFNKTLDVLARQRFYK